MIGPNQPSQRMCGRLVISERERRFSPPWFISFQIWKILLAEQEKIARAQLAAVQVIYIFLEFSSLYEKLKVLQDDIVRDSKNFKNKKLQNVKKQTDHIEIIQKDLQNCILDFCKAKTVYQEEGEEKTNNKILKKNTKRIKPSANTTNTYVLALLTANTHQVTVSQKPTLEFCLSRTDTSSKTCRTRWRV